MRPDGEKWIRNTGYGLVANNIMYKQLPEKLTDNVACYISTDQRKIKRGA